MSLLYHAFKRYEVKRALHICSAYKHRIRNLYRNIHDIDDGEISVNSRSESLSLQV
jgi:hypothetical protein